MRPYEISLDEWYLSVPTIHWLSDLSKVDWAPRMIFYFMSSLRLIDRSQYKYGLINHALAGALREIIQVSWDERERARNWWEMFSGTTYLSANWKLNSSKVNWRCKHSGFTLNLWWTWLKWWPISSEHWIRYSTRVSLLGTIIKISLLG